MVNAGEDKNSLTFFNFFLHKLLTYFQDKNVEDLDLA